MKTCLVWFSRLKRNTLSGRRTASLGAVLLAVTACASLSDQPAPAAEKALPVLSIRVDCGSCEIKQGVANVILESYAARRAQAGVADLAGAPAVLTIKTYAERGMATCFLAGPLGIIWSDAIDAELVFDGKSVKLTESTRVPFQGIESIARRIGEKSVDALMR